MLQQEFLIVNKLGLHARASALFVKTASRYNRSVKLAKEAVEVNGKSIMGIMMLAAGKGTMVRLTVEGEDEAEAIAEIGALIQNGFGED